MEKCSPWKDKINTSVDKSIQKFSQEDIPQIALFEASEIENSSPFQTRNEGKYIEHVKLDPWISFQPKKQSHQKKSVHLRVSTLKPVLIQPTDQSIIPQLKHLLQQLESPEKEQRKTPKEVEKNCLYKIRVASSKGFRREQKFPNQIETGFISKENQGGYFFKERRILKSSHIQLRVNNSSQDKKRKVQRPSFKDMDARTQPILSQPKLVNNNVQLHLTLLREARRQRTLRNILF